MKNIITKILKFSGLFLLTAIMALSFWIFGTGPQLPPQSDEIIQEVMNSKLPELVTGDSGYAVSGDYKIWYESISPKGRPKGSILLCMGMGADALTWPAAFIEQLTKAGYRVVRFDNRGTGMSDWVKDWEKNPYTLEDIAQDAVAILDTLKIDKVHLVGLSMGGMVAQEFALQNPDRTLSLTSLMSSGDLFDPSLPEVPRTFGLQMIKISLKYGIFAGEKNAVKMLLAMLTLLRGESKHEIETQAVAGMVLYNLKKRNGFNPGATSQHMNAVSLAAPRNERLKNLKIPALIIHGKQDPLMPLGHAKKLAEVIPGAKLRLYDQMGHDLPGNLIEPITREIIVHISANRKKS